MITVRKDMDMKKCWDIEERSGSQDSKIDFMNK